jgi:hypothetical protein
MVDDDLQYGAREVARLKYKPKNIRWLLVAESPPKVTDRFFYFEDVNREDSLYLETMRALFGNEHVDILRARKIEYLQRFKDQGFFLIDAVDRPILSDEDNDAVVWNNRQNLIQKMDRLIKKETPVVLIKASVWSLRNVLLKEGFNVINECMIDFPGSGNQIKFRTKLSRLMASQR